VTHYARTQHDIIESLFSQQSLCAVFQQTAAVCGTQIAFRSSGAKESITWGEAADRVRSIARGLASVGVGPGDSVSMLLRNTPHFHLIDLAVLHLGAVPVSMYPTDTTERMVAQIEASGSTVLLVEHPFCERGAELRDSCPSLEYLVTAGNAPAGFISLGELEQRSEDVPFDFEKSWKAVGPGDTACLLYTSGTTGAPKGVQIPHRAILASVAHYAEVAPVTPHGRVLSYLPAAHIADRFAGHYAAIAFGHTLTCIPDHEDLYDTLREVRPTHFFTVPRVLEKLMERARELLASQPDLDDCFRRRLAAVERTGVSDISEPDAAPLLPITEGIGLDQAEWLTVGSAPSARGALDALAALGLPFADIWGMTEIMVCTMSPPGGIRPGTIGKPFSRVELRLDEDGELMAKGPNMFSGYRNDPVRTAEALDDGWIRTGDLADIDADGYVRIIGRKKDMIINAAGKNMSPLVIEGAVKVASPLIDQVAAVGDGRRFVSAIIALDGPRVKEFADDRGIAGEFAELTSHPLVRQEVADAIARANETLSRVEQIRDWRIVEEIWRPGSDVMTGSMKLVRSKVINKYQSLVESIYE
jgi:long-chain acyl-CoA synthetase